VKVSSLWLSAFYFFPQPLIKAHQPPGFPLPTKYFRRAPAIFLQGGVVIRVFDQKPDGFGDGFRAKFREEVESAVFFLQLAVFRKVHLQGGAVGLDVVECLLASE